MRGRFASLLVSALAVGALLAGGLWCAGVAEISEPRPIAPRGPLEAGERATIDLFQRVSPAVVFITSISVRRDYFSLRATQVPRGSGTGFVWNERGHIVTNFHVRRSG